MQLSALDESDLGITEQRLLELFEPFVERHLAPDDPVWRREVSRRRRSTLKRYLKGLLSGRRTQRRDTKVVLEEYNRGWSGIDYGIYAPGATPPDFTPWEWRGRCMFAADVGATRFRQLMLIRFIERVRPKRVLEVGCGNGINLILLACRFPEIQFTGVELTEAGHRAAREFQEHQTLPEGMRAFAPEPVSDPSGFQRIDFRQGNAAALPFDDGAFDLVYSVLALEQMEQIRQQALSEFARVSGGHTLMIEPFRDVNSDLWPRLYVLRRGYFRGSIDELREHGLEPELATGDFPQESFLKACAVLCRKRG